MNIASFRLNLLIVVLLLMVHLGCASTPRTRFYALNPLGDSEKETDPGGEPCVSIFIGPVKIPDYLDQSEIVTRITPNEVRMGEFDKWAEPLESNISWVLSKNLSSLLCTKAVSTYPSRGSIPGVRARRASVRCGADWEGCPVLRGGRIARRSRTRCAGCTTSGWIPACGG